MFCPESRTTSNDIPASKVPREANGACSQKVTEKDENGRRVEPRTAGCTKQQIFRLSDYESIDARARQVGLYML